MAALEPGQKVWLYRPSQEHTPRLEDVVQGEVKQRVSNMGSDADPYYWVVTTHQHLPFSRPARLLYRERADALRDALTDLQAQQAALLREEKRLLDEIQKEAS